MAWNTPTVGISEFARVSRCVDNRTDHTGKLLEEFFEVVDINKLKVGDRILGSGNVTHVVEGIEAFTVDGKDTYRLEYDKYFEYGPSSYTEPGKLRRVTPTADDHLILQSLPDTMITASYVTDPMDFKTYLPPIKMSIGDIYRHMISYDDNPSHYDIMIVDHLQIPATLVTNISRITVDCYSTQYILHMENGADYIANEIMIRSN